MNKTSLVFLLFVVLTSMTSHTQTITNDSLVFSVEDLKVYKSEFLTQFNKSNATSVESDDLSKDEYVEMYIDFKLKVKAAQDLGLDTMPAFLNEYGNYRRQLADKFISNGEVTEQMVKDTYQSMITEVNVSHILVMVQPNATPEDTLSAYNKAIDILKEIQAGKNFSELALDYSEDKSVQQNKGEMGWFKAFKMVYPFERAAYKLDINEVSQPVRSQFGYHIIKKNDERPSRGKLTVAHIMKVPKAGDSLFNPKEEIFKIFKKLNNGESFENLAKQYSDHQPTASNGGVLSPFEVGQLNSSSFEEEAFRLTANNPISEPFKTKFGWHIVKYIDEEPVGDYESLKNDIVKKIKTSDRSKRLIENIKQDLMKQYEVRSNYEVLSGVEERIDSSLFKYKWKYEPLNKDKNTWILEVDENSFMLDEFLKELQQSQRSLKSASVSSKINEAMDKFTYAKLINIHNKNLENASPEFASEIKTYYEGLLMFEVMQKEIWQKTQDDSVGQMEYYNANKSSFKSKAKVNGIIASTTDKKTAKRIKKDMLTDSLSALKENYTGVIFQELDQVAIGSGSLPENLDLTLNSPKTYTYNGQLLTILLTNKTEEKILEFNEVRGEIISKLQVKREQKWLEELRQKYKVVINQTLLNTL